MTPLLRVDSNNKLLFLILHKCIVNRWLFEVPFNVSVLGHGLLFLLTQVLVVVEDFLPKICLVVVAIPEQKPMALGSALATPRAPAVIRRTE